MARRKVPEFETTEEHTQRKTREIISNTADRSEKTSWNRKMDNMVKLMALIRPIEDSILDLQAQKQPVFDDIQKLRSTMVKECVHPYEYIVALKDHALCKFCNKRLTIPNAEIS